MKAWHFPASLSKKNRVMGLPDSSDSEHFPISLGRVQGSTGTFAVVEVASVAVVLFSVLSGFADVVSVFSVFSVTVVPSVFPVLSVLPKNLFVAMSFS